MNCAGAALASERLSEQIKGRRLIALALFAVWVQLSGP